jgi:hypothetical protein
MDKFGGMSQLEVNTIGTFLDRDDIMLEWGSGGSTLYFPKFVKYLYSIEHDEQWFKRAQEGIDSMDIKNVSLFLVPNNLPRSFPYVKREEFVDYVTRVHRIRITRFDKVLIDGRARRWCAYEVLSCIDEDSFVFLHDWDREAYHEILDKYDLFKVVEKLAILRKR